MNATELFLKNGKPAQIFYCGECNRVFKLQDDAEKCCVCSVCGEVVERETIGRNNYTGVHGECQRKQRAKWDAEKLAKAELVSDYDGWIMVEGFGYHDGYFESVGELLEYLWDNETPLEEYPERAYCCEPHPFPSFCAEDIIENVCDDLPESIPDSILGLKELQAALDAFTEQNKTLISYYPDYKHAVLVPKPEPEEDSDGEA